MKIFSLLFLLFAMLSSCEQPATGLQIRLNLSPTSKGEFVLRNNFWEPIDTLTAAIDKSNANLQLPNGYYYLSINDQDIPLYLAQGMELTLNLNPNDPIKSLHYEGDLDLQNRYLLKKLKYSQSIPMEQRVYSSYAKQNEADFLEESEQYFQGYQDQLSQFTGLDESFRRLEGQSLDIDYALRLAQYQSMKRMVDQNPGFTVSSAYPNPYEKVNMNDASLLISYHYGDLLQHYISDELAKQESLESDDFFLNYQRYLAQSSLSPEIKDHLGFANAKFGFTYTQDLNAYYDQYMAYVESPSYKSKFQQAYDSFRMDKGKPSPNFEFVDRKDQQYTLDDFKGKYMYLDLWASWCLPCIAQLPYLKKLENEYAHKINFVSIAWSDDKTSWLEMLATKNLGGAQLYAPDKAAEFFTFYKVSAIPRFILLDPEGTIIEAKAKQPSDPSLALQFDKLTPIDSLHTAH